MYDAIDFAIPRKMMCSDRSALKQYLVVLKARLTNMKVTYGLRDDVIYIHCSLPRLLHENNIITMEWDEVPKALGQLESLIGIDLHHAVLCRVEIGVTLEVEAPPASYLALWHTCAHTTKDTFGSQSTVVFRNNTWCFSGYDKIAEANKKGYDITLYPKNLLRLEYRHKRLLKDLLGRLVTPWDLVEPSIYSTLVNRWRMVFHSIVQGGNAQLQSIPKSPKELTAGLLAIGLSSVGFDTARSMIEAGSRAGDITRSNASRMRKMISSISQQAGDVRSHNLINELRGKVVTQAEQELRRAIKSVIEQPSQELHCKTSVRGQQFYSNEMA